jgi:Flp pilus assembly protein TadB
MEEFEKQSRWRFSITPWPFVVASLFLAVATHYLYGLYGIVHWQVMRPSIRLEMDIKSLASQSSASQKKSSAENDWNEILERMKRYSKDLSAASSSLMKRTATYHITGIVSLLFTAVAFLGKPRWAGLVSLPFSFYAAFLSFIIM